MLMMTRKGAIHDRLGILNSDKKKTDINDAGLFFVIYEFIIRYIEKRYSHC